MTDLQRLILDAIIAAACAGEQCPTNNALAILVGVRKSTVQITIARLHELGHLQVRSTRNFRVAEIPALGLKTAEQVVTRATLARRGYARNSQKPAADDTVESCRRLLAAQLRTGAHWINCPTRLAAAMREARIAA